MQQIPFLSLSEIILETYRRLYGETSGATGAHDVYNLEWLCKMISQAAPSAELYLAQGQLHAALHRWNDAEQAFESALHHSKKEVERAACFYAQGTLRKQLGKYQQALPALEQAVAFAGHNRVLRSKALSECGWCHYFLGNLMLAEGYFNKTLYSSVQSAAEAHRGLGVIAYERGQYAESADFLRQAYDEFTDDDFNQLLCENDLGLLALYQRDYDAAFHHFHTTVEGAAALRDVDSLARAYNNIAEVHHKQRNFIPALQYAKYSLELSPYIVRRQQIAERLMNYGEYERKYAAQLLAESPPRKADAYRAYIRANTAFEQGLQLAAEQDDPRLQSHLWYNRGLIEFDQGHLMTALRAFQESQLLLEKYSSKQQKNGDQDGSLKALRQSMKIVNELEVKNEHKNILEWVSTPVDTDEFIDLDSRSYTNELYKELLPVLKTVQSEEGRNDPKRTARMLSTLKGEWFKNVNYTYLGFAWTTSTVHLRILVERGILEKKGHAKGAAYRLHPNLFPLTKH